MFLWQSKQINNLVWLIQIAVKQTIFKKSLSIHKIVLIAKEKQIMVFDKPVEAQNGVFWT